MLPKSISKPFGIPNTRSAKLTMFAIACFIFAPITQAQDTASPDSDIEEAQARVARWDDRVRELIHISESSAGRLPESQQGFYLALLAKLTWARDERAARGYMARAANIVLSQLSEKRSGERRRQAEYAVKALGLLFELDSGYATELVGRLNRDLDDESRRPESRDRDLAELYATIGSKVVRANPQLAYSYGTRSLRFGFATGLPRLAADLHVSDGALAERLIANAIVLARGSYTEDAYLLAFNLNRQLAETGGGKPFPTHIRKRVAELFDELLTGAAQVEAERPRRCGIAFYAPTVAPMIAELVPQRVQSFEQNFRLCLPHLKGADKQTTTAKGDGVPESIDDILKSARDTPDKDLKLWLYREALYRMMNASEFDRMLSILDGLDGDEYEKHAPIAWGNWRVRAGYGAAITAFEAGDIAGAARHVNETPARLRPFVRERLAVTRSVAEDRTFLTETLNGMQTDLSSMDVPSHDAAKLFLSLTELYLQAIPTESEKTFSKAVHNINKWDFEQQAKPTDDDWAPMFDYVAVSESLLDVDEYNIFASLRNVTSPHSRLRLTLGLLESSQKAHNEALKQLNALKNTEPKANDTNDQM